ncbi:TPA: ATP-dependent endonuclease [Vibrio vulnificus]
MIIEKVHIEKFRGFVNQEFTLAQNVTLISGQNGTQKSTLLGMLSQPFTITDSSNPMKKEKPLSGGNFKSAFQDMFRLSPTFDRPKEHEWTLFLEGSDDGFVLESIRRDSNSIRFWKKSDRSKGSGYIQLPVIFLSLKRLIPLAEEGDDLSFNVKVTLTNKEKEWLADWYNKILINDDSINSFDFIESKNKKTVGVTTNYYDWNSNSAGQDNLSKILVAVLSFRRLKENFPDNYKGGILAIDEIDATLYPASQIKLLHALNKFSSDYNIQVIATTHSLHMLEEANTIINTRGRENQIGITYVKKVNGEVQILNDATIDSIKHNLNLTLSGQKTKKKLDIYTEDAEAMHFAKAALGRKYNDIEYIDATFGCGNLINLASKKVPCFQYPNSIVILDGDARKKVEKSRLSNFVCLPGSVSPEALLANFLYELDELDSFWVKNDEHYSKQVCFKDISCKEICSNRDKAKKWYNDQLKQKVFGRQGAHVFGRYFQEFPEEKELFIKVFGEIYDKSKKHML